MTLISSYEIPTGICQKGKVCSSYFCKDNSFKMSYTGSSYQTKDEHFRIYKCSTGKFTYLGVTLAWLWRTLQRKGCILWCGSQLQLSSARACQVRGICCRALSCCRNVFVLMDGQTWLTLLIAEPIASQSLYILSWDGWWVD